MDYLVSRELNGLYIWLDIFFLLVLMMLLYYFNRRRALLFGLAGGLLYFIVDYGIFYLALGSRNVMGADTFWFLLWLSMSYGITNFVWIYLALDHDKRLFEWIFLIVIAWVSIGLISQNFGQSFRQISIARGTGYHGFMALILLVGYVIIIFKNLQSSDKNRISIPRLLLIGIGVQFAWEASLLLTGIRPTGWQPIIINSLLETNLGLPYLYFIHKAISKYKAPDIKEVPEHLALEQTT